jgi:hypothetical protein
MVLLLAVSFGYCSTLKMEAICSSETLEISTILSDVEKKISNQELCNIQFIKVIKLS